MENLHKRVIWNAVSAYFMVGICIFFLFNKDPYIDHPFVKNHVKVAFSLHVLLFLMLFIMSYPFLDGITFLTYSLNTLITAGLWLFLFGAILYGMFQAKRGHSMTLGEIFHKTGVSKDLMKHNSTEELWEEETLLLILAQIPFVWYIIYPQHTKIPHIRDVIQLNLLVTIITCLLFVLWYNSLASLIMLAYIIMGVFQGMRLWIESKITTLDMSLFPTAQEKYILQSAVITYISHTLKKNTFSPLKEIIAEKKQTHYERELSELEGVKKLSPTSIPSWIFYIPVLNLIWIFFLKTQDNVHIKNGITLTLLTLIIALLCYVFDMSGNILVFMLFPLFYGIGYLPRKAYHMPYIYDIYSCFAKVFSIIWSIFHTTRKLQKTDTQETIHISKNKKES